MSGNKKGHKKRRNSFQAEMNQGYQFELSGQYELAKNIYLRVLEENSKYDEAKYRLGNLFNSAGRYEIGARYFSELLSVKPNNVFALIGYADALKAQGELKKALDHYDRALKHLSMQKPPLSSGEKADLLYKLGLIYKETEQFELMENCMIKAVECNPEHGDAHGALGYVQSVMGRLDDAKDSYQNAIKANPRAAEWHRAHANLKHHDHCDEGVQAMQVLFDSPGTELDEKVHLGFGLGKAFEDMGEFDKAFEYWKEANRLYREQNPYDMSSDTKLIRTLKKLYNPKYAVDVTRSSNQVTPVFIVGMFRSGSTLVEQILASHSDVFGAGESSKLYDILDVEKGRDFSGLKLLSQDDWLRLGQKYLAELSKDADGHAFIVDKMLSNFQNIGFIRMMLPGAKIIHCRRDPMDTGLSAFKNLFAPGVLDCSYALEDIGAFYRQYDKFIRHWHRVLPGWIYNIDYEKLVEGPEAETRKLLEFIGLPFEEACLTPNKTIRPVKTASLNQVRQPIYRSSAASWKRYESGLSPLKQAIKRRWFGF